MTRVDYGLVKRIEAESPPIGAGTILSTQISNAKTAANPDVDALVHALQLLCADILAAPCDNKVLLDAVHENYLESACNLLHYLACRHIR